MRRRRARRRTPLSQDAVLAPWAASHDTVCLIRRAEPSQLAQHAGSEAARRRTRLARTILQRRGEPLLLRIAERAREIVGHRAPREPHARGADRVARRKAIGIIAEPFRIVALELNREIRRAAVIRRLEAVGLAAGRRADLEDLDIDA